MSKHYINLNNIKPFSSGMDRIGRVFEYNGKILRGVKPDSVEFVEKLLDSGLINKLADQRIFPETKKSKYHSKKFPLILEHDKINTVSYPQEWSFNMLKDAALLTLRVNQLANKFGYQLIDAHPPNILFNFNKPLFVDLGSFIESQDNKSWFASEQFIRTFYYPLVLWSKGYDSVSNKLVLSGGGTISHLEFKKITNPISRVIPNKFYSKLLNTYFPFSRISSVPDQLIKNRLDPRLYFLYKKLKDYNLLPFQSFEANRYYDHINRLKNPNFSYWGDYQDINKSIPKRFIQISKYIKERKIQSITDLASNNGAFVRYLLSKGNIQQGRCVDYDKNAIDQLYLVSKEKNEKIFMLTQNIMYPFLNKMNSHPSSRVKSEAVSALALTHHLILTQYVSIEQILTEILKYTEKYVFIEFMPLGLWNGKYSPPVPEWYTDVWFEDSLKSYCTIEVKDQLEKNRILYVCQISKII